MSTVTAVVLTVCAMAILNIIALLFVIKAFQNRDQKYDGFLDISEKDTKKIYQLEITTSPEKLQTQKRVVFRVRKINDTVGFDPQATNG